MFTCAVVMLTIGIQAASSLIDLQTPGQSLRPDGTPLNDSPMFWDRFESSFNKRADDLFADRLHPFRWIQRDVNGDVQLLDNSPELTTDIARSAFTDSLNYGLRDAALGIEWPLLTWLQDHEDFLANVLLNSIDSVEEKSVSPLDPSYGGIERSWWNEVARNKGIRFGVRPFSTSPYAFMSWRVMDGNKVQLLGHLRYRFRGFTDHSFELALSMPLGRGLSMDFGTSYRFGKHEEQKVIVVKVTKYFSPNALLHVGLEAQHDPMLVAGVSVNW